MTPSALLASLLARGAIGAGLVRDPDGTERVAGTSERLIPTRHHPCALMQTTRHLHIGAGQSDDAPSPGCGSPTGLTGDRRP